MEKRLDYIQPIISISIVKGETNDAVERQPVVQTPAKFRVMYIYIELLNRINSKL